MIWFGLVGFYGISTTVDYLMPNPLYTYYFQVNRLLLTFFKQARTNFFTHI